jgi:thioredoxin 1
VSAVVTAAVSCAYISDFPQFTAVKNAKIPVNGGRMLPFYDDSRTAVSDGQDVAGVGSRCYHPANVLNAPRALENRSMSENIVNVTDASFEEDVLKAEGAVLVDYWAEWCGPCKMIAPVLEEIAKEYAGKLKVCKLNIDENNETPPKFGIRGIPTLMLFKGGNVEATKVGALSKSQLAAFIDANL